uniref:Protein kinase domain-containing protein n=1 Tax=Arcella intermedia TaxID=1963864 RepID=A0A6B2LBU9_9EUKA
MCKEVNTRVAIKSIQKIGAKNKPEMLKNEVEILKKMEHPYIIKLYDIFESETTLYLVMELVTGGELFDRIVEREQYSEANAKEVMKQLFSAIEYFHSLGIVHRDLKPENLLLEKEIDDTNIKVTDFGLSRVYTEDMMMQTACGTPGYVAPEVLECKGYDKEVDMWSAGVILYILLCGYPPFYSENEPDLFESILSASYTFHSPYWDHISSEAKDLISHLLVVDPKYRLTATEALAQPWFTIESDHSSVPMKSEMRENLKTHNSQRKSKVSVGRKQ